MQEEIQVFVIASQIAGGMLPRDRTISETEAKAIAANATAVARALLNLPVGEAYKQSCS